MAIVKAPRRRVLIRWWGAAFRIKVILLRVIWLQTDTPVANQGIRLQSGFTAKRLEL